MATGPSPAIRIYRRVSAHVEPLRDALARAQFHRITPPDPLAEWEYVDDAGTRVLGGVGFVLVEAARASTADVFDARFRLAFPSDRALPDGGDAPTEIEAIAGSDESGKGDRRQSLAVAAVMVPVAREDEALAQGVRDSKTCSADEIRAISHWIQREFASEVCVIAPSARDQALHAHGGNESRLLAFMHAACLRALRARHAFAMARVDRFAQGRPVAAALAREFPEMVVDECVRGEQHVAVAAASIVARSLALM